MGGGLSARPLCGYNYMTINDFFSNNIIKIFNYLTDLVVFIFQPRKYFSILSLESKSDTIRRFIVYTIFFELISSSIFLTVIETHKTISILNFIGISVLDIIFSLYFLPVFIIIAKLCKPKVQLKIVFTYLLTYKFVLSLILVFFFAMFIFFENYIFAIIRGVLVYIYIIFLWTLFPFIFSYEFKNRIKLIFLSIFLCSVYSFLAGSVLSFIPSDKTTSFSLSVFYDPIGIELDEMLESLNKFNLINEESFTEKYFGEPDIITNHSMRANSSEFQRNIVNYTKELKDKLSHLDSLKRNYGFRTTKDLIEMKTNEVIYEISFLNELKNLFNSDIKDVQDSLMNKKLRAIANKSTKVIEYKIKFISTINSINSLRIDLYKYRLLTLK